MYLDLNSHSHIQREPRANLTIIGKSDSVMIARSVHRSLVVFVMVTYNISTYTEITLSDVLNNLTCSPSPPDDKTSYSVIVEDYGTEVFGAWLA